MFGHIHGEKFCRIRIQTFEKMEDTILEVPNDAPLCLLKKCFFFLILINFNRKVMRMGMVWLGKNTISLE